MQVVQRTKPHALGQLSAELIAALPALAPVLDQVTGEYTAVFTLGDEGDDIVVELPDTVSLASVEAVLDAHVPAPPPAPVDYGTDAPRPEREDVRQVVQQLRSFVALDPGSVTQAQLIGAIVTTLKTLCRVALFLIRDRLGF